MNPGLPEMTHQPRQGESPTPPAARRLQRFKLVNTKFVLGAVLVVLAIGGGARIISAADDTESMWSLRTALPRGTQLGSEDVVRVDVRLTDSKSRYIEATEDVVGKTLTRDVGEGELLPAEALRDPPCGRLVSIPVQPRHLPSTLRRGAHIDVYATTESSDKSQNRTDQLLGGVIVQYVNSPGGGAAATSGEWAVGVRVSQEDAQQVISAVRSRAVDIALAPTAGSGADPCTPKSADSPASAAPEEG